MSELERASKQLQPKKILCPADRTLGVLESEILLAHVLKKDRVWLHAHGERLFTIAQKSRFLALVSRRKKHEPIAYILGYKDFYGLRLMVNSSVLIPRPASETIVDLVLREKMAGASTILDIGTGSGAIAIAIAKHLPRAKVIATDISDSALRVARANAKQFGAKNVRFQKADLLSSAIIRDVKQNKKSLIITANLPYLPQSDKKVLCPDVVKYEPSRALFSGKEGNDLILRFLDQLQSSNICFEVVFIEFDQPQARALHAMTKKRFPFARILIQKDLEKRNRVLEIRV